MSVTTRPQTYTASPPLLPGHGGAGVLSVGSSLPLEAVPSLEIEVRLDLAPGWIERRTGIRSRHRAGPSERLEDHAARAALEALKSAGVAPQTVDTVLVATSTADEVMPNCAPLVADAIGAIGAAAMDIGNACNGFLAALSVGTSMIDSGRSKCVVVIGADFMTRITDPMDRGTAAVFADGAGAVVLAAGPESRIGPVILGSRADRNATIRVDPASRMIGMIGHETFKEAVLRLSEATEQAAAAAEVALTDIDLFVYHQANSRILSAVAERLSLPEDRLVDCIGELGNTSAATVPLALDHAVASGRLREGDRVLVGAFGAGFTWGAAVLLWGVQR